MSVAPLTPAGPLYKRVLLKMSGEALMGSREFGLDPATLRRLASDVVDVVKMGVEVSLVVGGGNIIRGARAQELGISQANGDQMGMLATVMNALAVQSMIEGMGQPTRVMSAIPMTAICEPYIRRRAIRHMEKGRVVICAAGTGNPFFTTDTAAALRAAELDCGALFKGTQVDGVYSADPKKDASATRYERLSYQRVLAEDLRVMDASAIALARESAIPIVVFSLAKPGAFARVIRGEEAHTAIAADDGPSA